MARICEIGEKDDDIQRRTKQELFKHFVKSVTRSPEEIYYEKLPFIREHQEMGDSKQMTLRRF